MTIGDHDVLFFLGAGASSEAGIPISRQMVSELEGYLESKAEWKEYRSLYNHIKSSVHYAAGLSGKFNEHVGYNIETLVNTLHELERNEQHPLYPFIAAWNQRLLSLTGENFGTVVMFRKLILRQLKEWMAPLESKNAEYYQGFKRLQEEITYPIKVFTLNYDQLVEDLESSTFHVQAGFPGNGPSAIWDFKLFEVEPDEAPNIYLYKLHGSVDWRRAADTNELYRTKQFTGGDPSELIFGRELKVEAADPYLFYLYAFREASLLAKLLIVIGYGFGDSHINNIFSQSLARNQRQKILYVGSGGNTTYRSKKAQDIAKILGCKSERIHVDPRSTSKFLSEIKVRDLDSIAPSGDEPF